MSLRHHLRHAPTPASEEILTIRPRTARFLHAGITSNVNSINPDFYPLPPLRHLLRSGPLLFTNTNPIPERQSWQDYTNPLVCCS